MSEKTLIAWTDHTANFWMGCLKVSAGCKNCYAETLTKNRMGIRVWGPRSDRQITKAPWTNVLRWDREARKAGESRRVFCMSLGDFFENHSQLEEPRARAWNIIRQCDALDWQILTKRPENIESMLPHDWGSGWQHVWLGTSIEDMRVAERADHLRRIPAYVRFISYEPALGPLNGLDPTGIHWVIYGGESGPGWRPEGTPDDPKCWARAMRRHCEQHGTAYFHKQSAAYRTEMGIELDGEMVRQYPVPRRDLRPQLKLGAA